ncbi:MAG TPA: tetratricopeptide repeat protein [Kofleriaceae bacterium]
MIALALIAIVASSFGLVAWRQCQEAQRQLARNELEQARSLVVEGRNSPGAIPHLIEATRLGIDTPVLRTLLAAAGQDLWRFSLPYGGRVHSATFSPDGTRVVTASLDGTARVWDATTGNPLGVSLKHEEAVRSAAFSLDGTRVVTASSDGTARIWQIAETGPLDAWIQEATSCLAQPKEAVGSSRVCQLTKRPATTEDLVTRAQALVAAGDREMHTHVWATPRARYLQALTLLDPSGSSAPPQDLIVEFRRSISVRLAILAAMEGRVAEARTWLGPNAPPKDWSLLDGLGSVAHDGLHEEIVAVALLRSAHEQDSGDPDILADLAEMYFAAGQIEQCAHAAAQIDQRRASLEVRVAVAALRCAALGTRPTDPHTETTRDADRLFHVYREVATRTRLLWTWNGTKHALTYGRYRFEDMKPIVEVLTLLEQPVTDETRAQLARLLAAPVPSHSNPPR